MSIARDGRRFREADSNQSAFIREAVELFVGATEKVANDLRLTEAYAAVRDELTDGEAEAARATRYAARRRANAS